MNELSFVVPSLKGWRKECVGFVTSGVARELFCR